VEDPQTGFQIFHTTWTAVITVAGAIVAFFTKRTLDTLDAKADKCDVDDLNTRFEKFLERQDRQHTSNTERLDKIILELGGRNNGNGK
jgi:hypothetical protein